MTETTSEVRADIDQTRARISGAIAELENKVDVAQRVKEHPWVAVGIAFGAGVALSASHTDVRAAKVTAEATRETGSRLGSALDGVVAALIAGVAEAVHNRIDGAVNEVVTSIRGSSGSRTFGASSRATETPMRAD
ncbi:MAG: hypothetical protein DMD72_05315 [Gemmatimonadetes bacterium]|nr:MAG: hypothetical protein DMD72_05315 [Gemmatimonadota bacterium]PYO78833.1 MAG: hypothetical protein DMD63_05940 [Gemmatimonadota bacterium]